MFNISTSTWTMESVRGSVMTLSRSGAFVSALDVEGFDDEVGEFVQDACSHLQREENQHSEPVEEVVHCGTGKRPGREARKHTLYTMFMVWLVLSFLNRMGICSDLPAELVSISCLHHSYDSVGDRSSNVGSHDDRHCRLDIQHWK